MLRILATQCDELAKNPASPFDASGLASDPRLPKQLQALAPISDKTWYRLKKSGELSAQTIQFDLAGAANDIVRARRMPLWIVSEASPRQAGDAFDDDPPGPEPLSLRRIFEALALNGTAAEEYAPIEVDSKRWPPDTDRERHFAIREFADIALGQSARLLEQAARTLVRERAPVSDAARRERLEIHRNWLAQLAHRAPHGDPDVMRDVTQALSRVDGMIAGTIARQSVPPRAPVPEPLDANEYGGPYAWGHGVIDMLVVRERFEACRAFATDSDILDAVRQSRIDYALERLAIFLIDSPTNSAATANARQAARALLEVSPGQDQQTSRSMDSAYARLRRIIHHYLNGDWAQVRATALLPAARYTVHEVQESYNWPLQAALAREASDELQGDNSGSDDIGRYLSNYLHDQIKLGAGPLLDKAIRDLAEESTPMPPPTELASTIEKLLPADTVNALSDAVWALAIDRNFAGDEADRSERLRTTNYGQLTHELWQAASTLADVANRLQGLAAPFDYAPYYAEDFEDPARIKPLLESLEQVWQRQPAMQLETLVRDLAQSDGAFQRSPDLDLFEELQIRLGLLKRTPPPPPLATRVRESSP